MQKAKDIFSVIANDVKNMYSYLFLMLSIVLFLVMMLKGGIVNFIAIPFILIEILLFIFCTPLGEKGDFKYTKITIISVLSKLAIVVAAPSIKSGPLGKILSVIIVIGFIGAIIYLFVSEEGKNFIMTLSKINVYGKKEDNIRKPGDAQLGYEVVVESDDLDPENIVSDKKKPVILPANDRFLHMLALGATGTGKTSQILLPMARNDIQDGKFGVICLEPKGDFAEQVFALGVMTGRDTLYFNPVLKDCPYFNPLKGKETDVIEDLVTTFGAFDSDSSTFFQDNNENLLRRAIKVIKRLEKAGQLDGEATMLDLEALVTNVGGKGMEMIKAFDKLPFTDAVTLQENKSISAWFRDDYFTGISGGRSGTKTFEQTSGIRNQIAKLVSNKYLRKVLNPPKNSELKPGQQINYIDFDKALREGQIIALTSNQGTLRDLSVYLGYFLILQLESAVFRRPGNVDTRRGCVLYIDEFQKYANPSFSDMLTQGRSYRIACVLATQNKALIGMNSGNKAKSFTDLVSTNARNVVIYPGANVEDATYYSKQFGEQLIRKENKTINRKRFLNTIGEERESVKVDEKYELRFRPNDIIYQPFSQVICSIIKNNTLQPPVKTKIEFIPRDLKKKMDAFIENYKLHNEIQDEDEMNNTNYYQEKIDPPAFKDDDVFNPLSKDDPFEIDLSDDKFNDNKMSIIEDPIEDDDF